MKKTISINISGVIFHIEEDGYEKLKSYLTSIQQYFSSYEDSQEIVTDIENRIAEKLLATLKGDDKNPARQAVTLEDVNGLVARMGTVADFEAVEKEEILVAGGTRQKAATSTGSVPPNPKPAAQPVWRESTDKREQARSSRPRDQKLTRDVRRKTLGGVAAGLAHYFMIDPVWVRVLLVGLVIGFPLIGDGIGDGNGRFGSLGGVVVLAYIMLWIVLPGRTDLEEEQGIKKFYRNPNDKVLGGVASGLAAYFGVETSVIRIALVSAVFVFGVGILAYIVLWIVAPEARSVTERMEMEGKPITLSNIESSVKSNLNISPTAPENGLTQLLLFPFRAIAAIFRFLGQAFGKTMGGLGTVIRVLFGLLLLCVGFSCALACITVFGAGIGILAGTNFGPGNGIPLSILREDVNFVTLLAGFVLGLLPSIALILTGLIVITRRSYITGNTVLTLLGVWVISGVIVATTLPQAIGAFRRYGKVETSDIIRPTGTPTFTLDAYGDDEFNIRPRIELAGYNGTDIKIVNEASARGRTRDDAEANARQIGYKPTVTDSTVEFRDEFTLPAKARFRNQELRITVYVPYGKPFRMSEAFGRYITNRFDDRELDDMPNNRWQFTTAGLMGVGFERIYREEQDNNYDDNDDSPDDEVNIDTDSPETRTFVFSPESTSAIPKTVIIGGNFAVRFQTGSALKVVVNGDQNQYDAMQASNENETLRIEQRGNNDGQRTGLTITLPSLEALRLSGSSNAHLTELESLPRLSVDLSGSSELLLKSAVGSLTTDQTGASKLILRGKANELTATLSGATRLTATQMRIQKADINTSGVSTAYLGDVPSLTKKTSGGSQIKRGTNR